MQAMRKTPGALGGAAILLALSIGLGSAQQPQGQPPQPPAPGAMPPAPTPQAPAPAAARPIVPASASSVAAKPESYYGQIVTIYAAVEQTLAPTAFSVDQDKTTSTGQDVVVLAPRLHEAVQPNTYVTVIGEVVKTDAAEIAKKARPGTPALPPDVVAKYSGKPLILATSVVNSAFSDLARFIPPPMTPEEAVLDKAMKAVGAANGALRKGIDGSSAELVKTNTAILAKAFSETEAFWKGRGKADAVKFAQEARAAVQSIETAAAAGNWGDAKTQAATLGQQCTNCHGSYRERGEDGSFFVKPGSSR